MFVKCVFRVYCLLTMVCSVPHFRCACFLRMLWLKCTAALGDRQWQWAWVSNAERVPHFGRAFSQCFVFLRGGLPSPRSEAIGVCGAFQAARDGFSFLKDGTSVLAVPAGAVTL